MLTRGFAAALLCLPAICALTEAPARAEDYPSHPVRIITDSASGSALDAVHFITHGYALGTDGAILTTPTPTQ